MMKSSFLCQCEVRITNYCFAAMYVEFCDECPMMSRKKMMKSSFLHQCEVRITEVTDHTFRKTLKSAHNSSRQLMSSNDQTRGRARNVASNNLRGRTRSNQNYQFDSLPPHIYTADIYPLLEPFTRNPRNPRTVRNISPSSSIINANLRSDRLLDVQNTIERMSGELQGILHKIISKVYHFSFIYC